MPFNRTTVILRCALLRASKDEIRPVAILRGSLRSRLRMTTDWAIAATAAPIQRLPSTRSTVCPAIFRSCASSPKARSSTASPRVTVTMCNARALGVSVELAPRGTLGQGLLHQAGDARHQIREGFARVLVQPFAFDRPEFHQSPRGRTSARRRAGTKILYRQFEKRGEALPQRARCRAPFEARLDIRLHSARRRRETAPPCCQRRCRDCRAGRPRHARCPRATFHAPPCARTDRTRCAGRRRGQILAASRFPPRCAIGPIPPDTSQKVFDTMSKMRISFSTTCQKLWIARFVNRVNPPRAGVPL